MQNFIQFMNKIGDLKKLKRKGWVESGIQDAESVADHSFGMAIMAMILGAKAGGDKDKIIKMALVHDLAESIVGDITPADNISSEDKVRLEDEAIRKLCENIENGSEIISLWEEFEKGETMEAQFIKKLDKLEMMFQAHKYNIDQPKIDLEDFWENRKGYDFGEMNEIFEELKAENNQIKK